MTPPDPLDPGATGTFSRRLIEEAVAIHERPTLTEALVYAALGGAGALQLLVWVAALLLVWGIP